MMPMFPGPRKLAFGAACAACDVFVHMPFFYMPMFYSLAEVSHRGQASTMLANATSGLEKYKNNFVADNMMSAGLFLPVQTFNFYYNKPALRVPFIVVAGAVWMLILSAVRGPESHEQPSLHVHVPEQEGLVTSHMVAASPDQHKKNNDPENPGVTR